MMKDESCTVCGHFEFKGRDVLWEELVEDWGLSPEEVHYVNVQQGTCCTSCGSNVRSIALAKAILGSTKLDCSLFNNFAKEFNGSLIEFNEAGTLHPILAECNSYSFAEFPEFDMMDLHTLDDNSYSLVVHSDTLEHIKNPLRALEETKRILVPGGFLCFTVPIIIGRLTTHRIGKVASYHGNPLEKLNDYKVYTEFGSDFWGLLFQAGFSEISLTSFMYPAGIAISAKK